MSAAGWSVFDSVGPMSVVQSVFDGVGPMSAWRLDWSKGKSMSAAGLSVFDSVRPYVGWRHVSSESKHRLL